MSEDTLAKLDAALQHVPPSRRDLLKRLLLGAGAVLLAPVSGVLAAGKNVGDCINDKLHAAPFNADAVTAKMSGSAVVLTGYSKLSGHPAALAKMAKQCGATKVTNNVSFSPHKNTSKPRPGGATSQFGK
jgi:hypothetical protein